MFDRKEILIKSRETILRYKGVYILLRRGDDSWAKMKMSQSQEGTRKLLEGHIIKECGGRGWKLWHMEGRVSLWNMMEGCGRMGTWRACGVNHVGAMCDR